uniref:Tetraspanin-15 n=1 Tax=Gopherus evgoodei TaxID=1825980 RepID=A0A8C4VYR4_9SAUR
MYVFLLQIIGLVILCIGIYAEVERQKHRTLEGIFLAPAVVLLLLGITMFAVSFIGMVGSLRDNRTLLKMVRALYPSCSTLWIFHSNIQEGIRHYYDDLDFKNILDFVQEKFSCCGGDEYKDWDVNQYHSCNSSGPLACGVPYTCCIKKVPGEVINTLCGYKTLEKERLQLVDIIHVRGCIHAVGLWFKDNFEVTFGIVSTLLLPQVLVWIQVLSHVNPTKLVLLHQFLFTENSLNVSIKMYIDTKGELSLFQRECTALKGHQLVFKQKPISARQGCS